MIQTLIDRLVSVVTAHSKVTIGVVLLATVVVGTGATSIPGPTEDAFASDSIEQEKLDYIDANYGEDTEDATSVPVYVQNRGGNVLSKESMLATLRFQQTVLDEEAVRDIANPQVPVVDVSNRVAVRLAGDPQADLQTQIDALEQADEAEVRDTVIRVLEEEQQVLGLMPRTYDRGTATAESRTMVFVFEGEPQEAFELTGPVADAQQVLFERINDGEAEDNYFMLTGPALQELQVQATTDTLLLIGPIALLLILIALTFAYRDVLDVLVGMFGVLLTLVWMFGLLGWLNVPFGNASIIAPILLIGLSIDYGLHVFMRYREERSGGERHTLAEAGEERDRGIRPSMQRALGGVGIALLLVTMTTAIGFLSNATSPLSDIRVLVIATALGVVAAFVVFVTIVPALKVELDSLAERFGRDRRKPALGIGSGRVRRFLTAGVSAARLSAVSVVVIALLLTAGGILAFGALDTSLAYEPDQPAQWQQDLPEPFGMDEYEYLNNAGYVQENFMRSGPGVTSGQILIEGDVTTAETQLRMSRAQRTFVESGVAFQRADGTTDVQSPLTVMRVTAAENESFAATFEAADATGDGVPDRNVREVYDALFEAAPDRAAAVIERRDGEYRSARIIMPVRQDADFRDSANAMRDSASIIDAGPDVTATATGEDVIFLVEIDILTDNVIQTLLIALGVIFLLLMVFYRLKESSASLGAVTVAPIGMVVTWVFGAMWVFDVPLTLLTALLMSLAIGLGTDYTIHISERFAQELQRTPDVMAALESATAGTGGALLGSTVTTVAAFVTLSLSAFPDVRQIGFLVAFALLSSFVVAVFVLPSILKLWARFGEA
ncbi:efflux RND transporter permease subunit [Halapricum hydrolyticum]|uniref:MMPL family transporter n=1 Tax=Halapricum hydrolyticum TaxID=2979991 RepID=A0AAE3IDN8_9EURY|nr:MMPL family transporter [Halapricum hydrolyticum]MCU4718783.1 MMPL family transporter [Halapricum hydrolyticum]MCU4727809.1 MMPL family transporter [Halapricum hydrolyticum]